QKNRCSAMVVRRRTDGCSPGMLFPPRRRGARTPCWPARLPQPPRHGAAHRHRQIPWDVPGRARPRQLRLDPRPHRLQSHHRSRLVQRELAARACVSRRSVQDWEAGVTLPTAERLQALIRALLEVGGLTRGRELAEARELWAAVEREGPRMHAPFDEEWLAAI